MRNGILGKTSCLTCGNLFASVRVLRPRRRLAMREAIYAALKPVRSRQQLAFVLRSVVAGVAVGAAGALALGAARRLGLEVSWVVAAAVLAAGPVLGLLAGLVLRRGWHDAAAAVDGHYGLKDRAVTALAFSALPAPTELQAVAVSDALGHL